MCYSIAIMHVLLLIAMLSIGAQEIPPNTAPAAATKSGSSVSKLNGQKKAGKTEQVDSKKPPEAACVPCRNCCPVEQPHTKSKEEQAKADSLDLLYRRYMWATIVGVIGAWIGIAILIVQTIISRNSSQKQMRAYVGISSMTAEIKKGNALEIVVGYKNHGLTPAYDVCQFVDHWIGEYPLKATLKEPSDTQEGSKGVIFPGPEYWTGKTLDMTQRPAPSDKNAIYVYGEIKYKDIFGKKHYTKYRYHLHPTGTIPTLVDGNRILLNVDQGGNEAS